MVVGRKDLKEIEVKMGDFFPRASETISSIKSDSNLTSNSIGVGVLMMMTIAHASHSGKESSLTHFVQGVTNSCPDGEKIEMGVYAMAQLLLLDVDNKVRNFACMSNVCSHSVTNCFVLFCL